MNILINAASANMGGAITYLKNILDWLPHIAEVNKVVVVVPKLDRFDIDSYPPTIEWVTYPYGRTDGLSRIYFDQIGTRALIKKYKIDILFSSTGFGTFFPPVKQVVLIRNAIYFSQDYIELCAQFGVSTRQRKDSAILGQYISLL